MTCVHHWIVARAGLADTIPAICGDCQAERTFATRPPLRDMTPAEVTRLTRLRQRERATARVNFEINVI